jgi:outer membrane protein assembly factor BamB
MRQKIMRGLVLTAALLVGVPVAAQVKGTDGAWNQWRGPKRDGVSPETGLLKEWPSGGPSLAWKTTGLGEGYSSVSFWGDRLFTLGDVDGACHLIALNAADGKIVWKARVGAPGGHKQYPGPRSTPSSDGKLVIALGQEGDLVCVDMAAGKERWRKNLEKDFGGRMMSGWRWSESPLLDGNLVVVTPGGSKGTVAALEKESGRPVWQSAGLTDRAAYASLVPVEIGGVRQYVVLTGESVAGIGARDGKLLWRAARRGDTAVVSTPIYRDGTVFVTSAYGAGGQAFGVNGSGGNFKAEPDYAVRQMENHHGGVILVGDHVYGTNQGGLLCVEFKTGKVVWQSRGVGKGSVAYADGMLVVRSEDPGRGTVALVEATPAGYREKGRFNQPDLSRRHTWSHPVVYGGKLYLRDQDVLLCYDVKAD